MPQPASQSTLGPGTVLSKRYKIEQLIGTGGYASVYRASDLTFGYTRAIKEVSDPDPGVRNQFRLEAELLINSRHPNIPHGYHLIEDMKPTRGSRSHSGVWMECELIEHEDEERTRRVIPLRRVRLCLAIPPRDGGG